MTALEAARRYLSRSRGVSLAALDDAALARIVRDDAAPHTLRADAAALIMKRGRVDSVRVLIDRRDPSWWRSLLAATRHARRTGAVLVTRVLVPPPAYADDADSPRDARIADSSRDDHAPVSPPVVSRAPTSLPRVDHAAGARSMTWAALQRRSLAMLSSAERSAIDGEMNRRIADSRTPPDQDRDTVVSFTRTGRCPRFNFDSGEWGTGAADSIDLTPWRVS